MPRRRVAAKVDIQHWMLVHVAQSVPGEPLKNVADLGASWEVAHQVTLV